MTEMVAYFDGAAVLHPTRIAGYGAVIFLPDGTVVEEIAASIKRGSVNQAEYRGCLAAVLGAIRHDCTVLHLYGDSQLIVNQINGKYATYKDELKMIQRDIQAQLKTLESWDATWLPREENTYADLLSKIGLALAKDDYKREPWK